MGTNQRYIAYLSNIVTDGAPGYVCKVIDLGCHAGSFEAREALLTRKNGEYFIAGIRPDMLTSCTIYEISDELTVPLQGLTATNWLNDIPTDQRVRRAIYDKLRFEFDVVR